MCPPQATHIQFLTLLFPSALETKLILILLAPLAMVSASLTFGDLIDKNEYEDLADAISAICDSTLTLLYASALLLWGLVVNRTSAWRTDGGTAAFGALAIGFAFVGTAVNFLEVREDSLQWLDGVVWGVLLWQSWLGFWWWVGSGMYAGEVEDRERRDERRRKRDEKRGARRRRRLGANADAMAATPGQSSAQRWVRRVAGSATASINVHVEGGAHPSWGNLTFRRGAQTQDEDGMELRARGPSALPRTATVSSSASDPSTRPHVLARYIPLPAFVTSWLNRLSSAHDQATRTRANASSGFKSWGIMGILGTRHPRSVADDACGPSPAPATEHDGASHLSSPAGSDGGDAWEPEEADEPPRTSTLAWVQSSSGARPPPNQQGQGMGSDAWWWRGRIRRARLRQVDVFPG